MKKILTLCLTVFAFLNVNAQTKDPVKWVASYKAISATEGEVIITAAIDKGWHIYSQDSTSDGPVPTSLVFDAGKNYTLIDTPREIGAHMIFDKAFDANISSFSDKAEFRQKIKLNAKANFNILIKVEFMCCDDMMCLPPKVIDLIVKAQ
jgi:DsbC/DsbD-like thiol-disulfide interchange protein